MQKIAFYISYVVCGIINFIHLPRHCVQAVFTPGKKHPALRIYLHRIGVPLQPRYRIAFRIAGVREQQKVFVLFKSLIYAPQIVIDARANAFAGGKKIMHRRYFSRHVFFRERLAVLRGKPEGLHGADGRHIFFGKARYHPRHHYKKYYDQPTKKQDVKKAFARHEMYCDAKVRHGAAAVATRLCVSFCESFCMKVFLFSILLFITTTSSAQSKAEAAIRALLHQQTDAWNRGDVDGFMQTYWKSDSLLFIGKTSVTRGWQQTLERYKKNYPDKAAMGTLSFDIVQVKKLSRRYYYVVGGWQLQRAADAPSGHYTLLLKKVGGSWKIISDHSS